MHTHIHMCKCMWIYTCMHMSYVQNSKTEAAFAKSEINNPWKLFFLIKIPLILFLKIFHWWNHLRNANIKMLWSALVLLLMSSNYINLILGNKKMTTNAWSNYYVSCCTHIVWFFAKNFLWKRIETCRSKTSRIGTDPFKICFWLR